MKHQVDNVVELGSFHFDSEAAAFIRQNYNGCLKVRKWVDKRLLCLFEVLPEQIRKIIPATSYVNDKITQWFFKPK